MSGSDGEKVERTVERVARESYGRLVAYLSVHTQDLAGAEDALSEALLKALTVWPRDGVPQNPEAWLLTTARNSIIDFFRHQRVVLDSEPNLLLLTQNSAKDPLETNCPDERLKLLFVCAHPAIDPAMHTPLMLQAVLGLDAVRISGAFLVSPKLWDSVWCVPRPRSVTAVSVSKCRSEVHSGGGWMRSLKRFTLRLALAGTTWRAPISTAAVSPKKPSGSREFFLSKCLAKQRFKDCWRSCSTVKRGAPPGAIKRAVTFLFPSRIRNCGRSL